MQDFSTLIRTACNLELRNCYYSWVFLFNIFRPWLTTERGGPLYLEERMMERLDGIPEETSLEATLVCGRLWKASGVFWAGEEHSV